MQIKTQVTSTLAIATWPAGDGCAAELYGMLGDLAMMVTLRNTTTGRQTVVGSFACRVPEDTEGLAALAQRYLDGTMPLTPGSLSPQHG